VIKRGPALLVYCWCIPVLLLLISCVATSSPPHPIAATWLAAGPDAGGWPMFGHDAAHTGLYPTAGPWPALNGRIAWQRDSGGAIFSAPVLADDILYVGSTSGSLFALDAQTGAIRWQHAIGQFLNDATPVVAGRVVFVGANRTWIEALDATDGQQLWAANLGETIKAPPTYADGLVLVNATTTTYALNARTGAVRWRFHEKGSGWPTQAAPAVWGQIVYIAQGTTPILYALDLLTGRQIWSYNVGDRLISSPLITGRDVVIGTWNGLVEALDATTGALRWRYNVNQARKPGAPEDGIGSSLAAADGLIFVGTYNGSVLAISTTGGRLRWVHTIASPVLNVPAIAGSTLYVGGGAALYALAVVNGALLWHLSLGEIRNGLALGPGRLYAATVQGYIYAVD
jgi:outer membrane protein assembly factor BamB